MFARYVLSADGTRDMMEKIGDARMKTGLATAPGDSPRSRFCFQQWQGALINWVRSDRPDLSNRQLAVLLVVTADPAPQTLRGLADHLNVTKTAIFRALDHLVALDYLRRLTDKNDRRNMFIVATASGHAFVDDLAESLNETRTG